MLERHDNLNGFAVNLMRGADLALRRGWGVALHEVANRKSGIAGERLSRSDPVNVIIETAKVADRGFEPPGS